MDLSHSMLVTSFPAMLPAMFQMRCELVVSPDVVAAVLPRAMLLAESQVRSLLVASLESANKRAISFTATLWVIS